MEERKCKYSKDKIGGWRVQDSGCRIYIMLGIRKREGGPTGDTVQPEKNVWEVEGYEGKWKELKKILRGKWVMHKEPQ